MKMVNYVTMVNSKSTLEWNTVILRSPQAYEKCCKYIVTVARNKFGILFRYRKNNLE